jgi:hypothetical protein
MKNKKLNILATVTVVLFLISGCGSSDATIDNLESTGELSNIKESNPILEFKTEATYDLSSYLFTTLPIKNFRVKIYKDDTNIKDNIFGILEGMTKFYKQTISKENNTFTFKEDDQFDTKYILLDDRIQAENDTLSEPIDIVRFADIGDNIGNIEKSEYNNFNANCKLVSHLDTKNNFKDVLQVICESDDGLYRGEYFFAKDIGSILEINSICTDSSNCKNIVAQFNPIN